MADHEPIQPVIAWTGGTKPRPLGEVHQLERDLVLKLQASYEAAFRAFWLKEPSADTRDRYLMQARYDAHATFRGLADDTGHPIPMHMRAF